MDKILIVDDENDIAELISDILEDEGYETVIANDGNTAISKVKEEDFDLILLDVMMPDISGTEVCAAIRNLTSCPIIFVTAKTNLTSKLVGFEVGADDYITKPFINEELVARVKAHLRRDKRSFGNKKGNTIEIGEIKLNKESFEVFKNGKPVMLSTKEFELLRYLMENAGIVLSKDQIYQSVWKNNYGDIGTVAVNIKSLRNKLDQDEKYIKTIWGMGYKFVKVQE
ncbi:MAG TPA: response regulator transcription factor [Candidatus Aphodocola excrementigallinarum]|uniref:Response regulator transcription factor n=1 Tax=Candidatus Aphodocola excrementigallinarum TaxID=2840670 RepID=A0A9D1IQI8_9FIRM|nr:response regulator transcription factor [Candidatus Aphodocola excrementigallinarum]